MSAPAPASWPAPCAGELDATVVVPGSKSLTNRALILAAQASAPSTILGGLRSRDTALMVSALRTLGIDIQEEPGGGWRVTGHPPTGPAMIDCGLAGTVMRFLPPFAAGATGPVTMDGDGAARRRPMATILNALRELGVAVEGDALPFTIRGTGSVAGGTVRIDASASSQFVSGLLLSGAGYRHGLTVLHTGTPVPSLPHIEMTVTALRSVGVAVDDTEADTWRVEPGPVGPWTALIEPDLSNATPFLAAAAVAGGTVRMAGWPVATTQPGDAIRGILSQMGADVSLSGGVLTVTGSGSLAGIDADLHEIGELTPTVTAVASFADGPSHLRGIGHLRGHETDRLAALVSNIRGLGGDAEETEDGIIIRPATLHGGTWPSWADHRMATAGAIIGLRVAGVQVLNISTTAKTLPGFRDMWAEMVAGRERRGAGP